MWNRCAAAAAAILALGVAGGACAEDLDRAFAETAAHTLTTTQAPRWAEVQARARITPVFAVMPAPASASGSGFAPTKASRKSKACKPAPAEKIGKTPRSAKARAACKIRGSAALDPAARDNVAPDLVAAIHAVRHASIKEQLVAVDRAINTLPYVSDTQNWGVADYWETPQEMLTRGGDCEGFALTKYFALRQLGVRDEIMRIAVVWDRRDREEHAILLVRAEGETWILDNKTREPIRLADDSQRYSLIYSLNESGVRLPQAVRTADRAAPQARIVNGGRTLVLNVRRSGVRATA